jgi:L-alanine-DL-glutamate epimerase-like enolase superfamily enzyme
VRAGFRHLKVKVGIDAQDVDRVRRMYEAAPVPVRVRVDANQGWDHTTTVRAVDAWTRAGIPIEFVEQPLDRWDLSGHAALRTELAGRYAVPLMLDESMFDRHDLDRIIDLGAADLVNIKLAKCGGLTAGLRLAATARAAGLGVMVGSMMESAVGGCAAATLAAVVSPETVHDLDSAWWTADGGTGRYRGNRFVLPTGPGLSQITGRLSEPGSGLRWTVRTGRTPPRGPGRAH